jgi:hypothetical protein
MKLAEGRERQHDIQYSDRQKDRQVQTRRAGAHAGGLTASMSSMNSGAFSSQSAGMCVCFFGGWVSNRVCLYWVGVGLIMRVLVCVCVYTCMLFWFVHARAKSCALVRQVRALVSSRCRTNQLDACHLQRRIFCGDRTGTMYTCMMRMMPLTAKGAFSNVRLCVCTTHTLNMFSIASTCNMSLHSDYMSGFSRPSGALSRTLQCSHETT